MNSIYHKLLFSDKKFFNDIHEYMTRTKWVWWDTNGVSTPTIEKLMKDVMDLSLMSDRENGIECGGGGFYVAFDHNNHLIVKFCKDGHQLFYKKISKNDIRKLKLENII